MLLLLLCACLDHELAPGAEGGEFVAMQSDFAGFASWPATEVGDTDTGGHPDGARTVHLSGEAPEDAAEFPVGTRIVKRIVTAEGEDLHAMAKRGAGYNAEGAVGWEWFELAWGDTGEPVIVWRGAAPPDGEGYGTLGAGDTGVESDCNTCHAGARTNDFVWSLPLGGA